MQIFSNIKTESFIFMHSICLHVNASLIRMCNKNAKYANDYCCWNTHRVLIMRNSYISPFWTEVRANSGSNVHRSVDRMWCRFVRRPTTRLFGNKILFLCPLSILKYHRDTMITYIVGPVGYFCICNYGPVGTPRDPTRWLSACFVFCFVFSQKSKV